MIVAISFWVIVFAFAFAGYALGYREGRDAGDHAGWMRCYEAMRDLDQQADRRNRWRRHRTSDFAPPADEVTS